MKRLLLFLAAVAFFATPALRAADTQATPHREFRSAWVATVWALDWPETIGSGANTMAKQKASIDRMLDSLHRCNFNAVNFQVRSMCDAMYQSSYEPWSSYLTGTRGLNPGWDPLEYVVEACHARGMECHAWVNPYRFSSNGINQWSTAADEALKSSGILISSGTYVVLDPAKQETIDRIVNVCREIATNYDVDGILYDDYFYPDGINSDSSAPDYAEWQNSGTPLSFAAWRRDNVNRMVRSVYEMIQEVRPEIRFGISPAGVACTNSTLAASYGVRPCPSGSDWQYNGIYSDPLAWLQAGTIDYISPQVYWRIGNTSADYGKITPWWGEVAHKFGRHVYISHSISNITSSSGESLLRKFLDEVNLNRETNEDAAPGSIFYSCKYLYRMGADEELATYLGRTAYTRPALPPAMSWKPGTDPGTVTSLASADHVLTWNGFNGYKYSIYAIPNSVDPSQFVPEAQYLVAVSYEPRYVLPANLWFGYYFAVCPVDRMNNEFAPTILVPDASQQLAAPVLVSPADGEILPDPFTFSWEAVTNAQGYMIEIAHDEAMTDIFLRATTTNTTLSLPQIKDLKPGTCYWRVRSCAEGWYDGVSETRSFTPSLFTVIYPEQGQEDVHPSFTATWLTAGLDNEATLEIATSSTFSESSIVFSGTSTTGTLDIPKFTLVCGTIYYLRVRMMVNGVEKITNPITFTTSFLVAEPPVFAVPTAGGTLYSDQRLEVVPQEAALSYVLEVSTSEKTWGRTRYVESLNDFAYQSQKLASEIKTSSKYLADGTTYYARARASYATPTGTVNTDYCTPIAFVYSSGTAPVGVPGDVNGDGIVSGADVTALYNVLLDDAVVAGNADVNGDGVVSGADVTALYNILLN